MPLIALAVALLAVLALIALMPLSLVQRYRVGTARRLGRGWVATLNLLMIGLSAAHRPSKRAAVVSLSFPRNGQGSRRQMS